MSGAWCQRAATNWRSYLQGYVTEAESRISPAPQSAREQLDLRSVTIGVQPVLDIAERLGHFELPESLHATDPVAALRQLASEIVALDNDIVSVEKEKAIGDVNLVLSVESELSVSRGDAIEVIRTMVADRLVEFTRLSGELGVLARKQARPVAVAVRRFHGDSLCAVMRGAYDWEQTCARYRPGYVTAESNSLVTERKGNTH